MNRVSAMLAFAALAAVSPLSAQVKPPVKDTAKAMDHSKMDHSAHHGAKAATTGESHAASGWKELDSYHQLMMQTWHPIKEKGDVSAIRVKAGEIVASAKLLAASKAPKGCDTPALKTASTGLIAETEGVATLVSKKADDATLSAAMKTLHDKFEVLEEGCKPAK